MPVEITYFRVPILIVMVLMIAFLIRRAIKKNRPQIWVMTLLIIVYSLGKLSQFWGIGPEIVTSYFSDIGFIPTFAYLGSALTAGKFTVAVKYKMMMQTSFWFVVAIGWELANMFLLKVPDDQWGPRGDVNDIAIFCAMFVFTTALVGTMSVEQESKAIASVEPKLPPSRNRKKTGRKTRRRKVVAQGNR